MINKRSKNLLKSVEMWYNVVEIEWDSDILWNLGKDKLDNKCYTLVEYVLIMVIILMVIGNKIIVYEK